MSREIFIFLFIPCAYLLTLSPGSLKAILLLLPLPLPLSLPFPSTPLLTTPAQSLRVPVRTGKVRPPFMNYLCIIS